MCIYILTEAVIGFKRSRVAVQENEGMVQVCVEIFNPDIVCPVVFPIELIITTSDGTAGNTKQYRKVCMKDNLCSVCVPSLS